MDDWNRIATEAEARRICDRNGFTTHEMFQKVAHSLRYEGYRRAIQPFMQQKVNAQALRLIDRIIVRDDGTIDSVEYQPLPPQAVEYMKNLDELIESEARKWGLTPNSGPNDGHQRTI